MPLLTNISFLATCRDEGPQADIHGIDHAALVWEDGEIVWVGAEADLPSDLRETITVDAERKIVVPGLIDCHTHLAFGGWRADEFEMRSLGKGYLEIARAGGGIAGTMRHTRAASEDELLGRCRRFLGEMVRLGVTTVECKSGYGLTPEDELKLLRVYHRLRSERKETIVSTFLGAHIVPPEFRDERERYINLVEEEMMPRIASEGLAEFCDVFVEEAAFTREEARRILDAGLRHGLRPKLHADQLSDTGGAELAAEVRAASADHLEFSSEAGMHAMAEADVVAVALPLASLYLNQRPMQARRFIEAGVPVAVATDFNPGSAPSYHLPLAMTLACTMNRMTPSEVLKGVTIYAAKAIDRHAKLGSLEPGKQADFVLVDAPSVNHWMYHFRANAVEDVFVRGERAQDP